MGAEVVHLWVGTFGTGAPDDYFEARTAEDGTRPISQFVEEQGEIFVDHDWMERTWFDEPIPVADLVSRHLQNEVSQQKAVELAEAAGLTTANVAVIIDVAEVGLPRTVRAASHEFIYLGRFDNTWVFPWEATLAAAEAGDPEAQASVGCIYLYPGPDLEHVRDADKAEYWMLKAAEHDQTAVYSRLYHLYACSPGITHRTPEPQKAFHWISKAAQLGWGADLELLARAYETGYGTAQDDVKALQWYFLKNCSYDHDRHDVPLKELIDRLSAEQIAEAERLALEWIELNRDSATRFSGMVRNPITGERLKPQPK